MSGPYDKQQILAPAAGRSAGQTVTQTTSVHRSTEVLHGHPQQHQHSSSRGDRQRLPRSGSSTSLSSSLSGQVNRNIAVAINTTAGPILTGSYPQPAAGNGYAYGATIGGASFGSIASGPRRQVRHQKQVIRLPDQCAGQVRQVRRRMPTPEPDTLDRVYIQRAPIETIEEITEIPTTPPPRVQERTVVEPAGPPQIIKRVIRVPPRCSGYGGQQQLQSASFVGGNIQPGSSLLGAGSYGNVQQAAGGYQQYASGAPAYTGGAIGGGYQQYASGTPAYTGGAIGGGYAGAMGGGYGGAMGGGYGGTMEGGYGGIMGGGYGGAMGGGYGGAMGGGYGGAMGGGYGGTMEGGYGGIMGGGYGGTMGGGYGGVMGGGYGGAMGGGYGGPMGGGFQGQQGFGYGF